MAKQYITFASGWLKTNAKADQYISSQVNSKDGYTLTLKNSKGEEVPVTSFACFFNETKTKPNAPDTRFVLTIEE